MDATCTPPSQPLCQEMEPSEPSNEPQQNPAYLDQMERPSIMHNSASGPVHNNIYRVGEYVYIDTKGAHPYLIRRIEEFNKTTSGVNEVRVSIVYRRRDISTAILRVADAAERNWPDYVVYDDHTGEEVSPAKAEEEEVKAEMEVEEKEEEKGEEKGEEKSEEEKTEEEEPKINGEEKKTNGEAPKENGESGENGEKEAEEKEAEEKPKEEEIPPFDWGLGGLPYDAAKLTDEERYRLRQREVYLSRKEEKLLASHIRGRCSVNLLCDVEASKDYLESNDCYFYSLVYDNEKLSMLADKGAIRVGKAYQAELPEEYVGEGESGENGHEVKEEDEQMETDENKENGDLMIDEEEDEAKQKEEPKEEKVSEEEMLRETPVYFAENGLSENDIDRYLIHVRAVGVFARVIDPNSATKYPSAQMIAALASKDSTIFYALGLLHKAGYNIAIAQDHLVPPADVSRIPNDVDDNMGFNTLTLGGPLLVRDQLEEFSAAESCLFEEGVDRIGKDFADIKAQLLPWKSLASIVEYYYLYKTTNRYIDGRKKRNAIEKEGRLQSMEIYVPNAAHESHTFLIGSINMSADKVNNEKGCTGCKTHLATNWYKWGNRGDDVQLCHDCWIFWRQYGGLKKRTKYDHFDTDIAADPDVAQALLKSLSYATPSTQPAKDPKRYGANSYTMYTVVSASDLNPGMPGGPLPLTAGSNAKLQKPTINMKTNLFTKMVRRALPKNILSVKKCGRSPFDELDLKTIATCLLQMDQARLCEVMKTLLAPNLQITPSTFQSLVANLITQFSGPAKRPASPTPSEGQPPAKKPAPSPTD